jgi:hypothetical protein
MILQKIITTILKINEHIDVNMALQGDPGPGLRTCQYSAFGKRRDRIINQRTPGN